MEESEEVRAKHEEVEEEEQELWSWGAGTDGQLGTGRLQDELLPQLLHLPSLSSVGPISLLACGSAHVLALTSGGKVLTWGRGTSGQLGHSEMVNSPHPKLVMSLDTYFITHASAGWNHSGFVSDAGAVFTSGDGSFGQLGHGDYSSHCCSVKVSFFDDQRVEQIACGMRHSHVLLKGGSGDEVYGFGSGKRGQLGISKDKIKSISLPERIYGFEGVTITGIIASGDQSAALSGECCKLSLLEGVTITGIIASGDQIATDGHLYSWGKGFGGTSSAHSPQSLPTSLQFIKAAVGWNHALVLTGGGEVFILGGNHHGVLGNPDKMTPARLLADSTETILEKVPGLEGNRIVDIAAGAEHSVILTDDGVIKTWGWGEHGQLGLGNTCDQTSPQEVSIRKRFQKEAAALIKIYCGCGFTIAVSTPHLPSQTN